MTVEAAEGAPATTKGPLAAAEYGLRLVFFASAPFAVVLTSALVSMSGALVNIVLALVAFFFGEAMQRHVEKRGWLGRLLKRQLAFESYYREHPPKPFLYYVFYPLLFPYWLFVKPARREFLLFKGYTVLTLAILVVSGVYRYFAVYKPELGMREFALSFGVGFVIETIAVLTLLMPMVTSVVTLHQRAHKRRLVLLLAVALVSAGLALGVLAHRHRTFPSLETRQRVAQRTLVSPAPAKKAMKNALTAAWKARRQGGWGREDDGTLEGPPLDEARAALQTFYRPDEAAAFDLWTSSKNDKVQLIVLYAEGPRKGRPVYLAMRSDGTVVEKSAEIPRAARKMMRTAGEL